MKKSLILIAVAAMAALALSQALDPRGYGVRVLCLVLMAATLGQCWNIVGGLANQISLGHAAFFGIGAYSSTVLQTLWGITPWLGMLLGMVLAMLAAVVLALPTMRLKGPYFALATLAFGEACRILATSLPGITGGPQGISVPFVGNSWAMMQFRGAGNYVYLFTGLFVIVSAVFACLAHGKMGYLLRAVRENEEAAEVAGVNTLKVKLIGALISAALTAATGTLFAQFTFFFDPESVFSAAGISIRAALIAIVGGVGTLAGPIIGALVVVPLEEILNTYLSNKAAGIAPFTFGIVLIAIVLWRPRGLVSVFRGKRAGARA
ncbi:branched-chain amino acid ABC transporter permease [Bordetella pseudohinzii]|uniref:ABC transporter permease n=1 Tax=Bordetella pseudohinzii TaxID=1331258 RepID=A0A0J6BYN6_9BORD|nr:branched-chain amino acid ABC transporter permease [Bordetella pseudohinzii]ANY14591.1 ABC transporter permease [Bordetella pseudohinzii]KMM26784.1 ABC transporter permease [Bordetella pseudohinzii]KXA75801.1 ABC transporter permease [Bordetella pseudohinzii]KXA81138.1 ABC transporter permease [Bordetella pseudohinzii]CUI62131.1 LIV-I protein H [Bordetella pseudohinzii]